MVLSCDASLPSGGSRRARFPALRGTMKALRLPTRASAVAYLFRFYRPRDSSWFRVRRSAPARSEVSSGPGPLVAPDAQLPANRAWARMGSLRSSGNPSRAFAPFQDPGRTDVSSPLTATPVLPPRSGRRRLRHWLISGLARSFGTCCHTLHACRCRTRPRLASG
jgi:hypothetical protein